MERVNIKDIPVDLKLIIYQALRNGQVNIATEVIGNYINSKGGDQIERNTKQSNSLDEVN